MDDTFRGPDEDRQRAVYKQITPNLNELMRPCIEEWAKIPLKQYKRLTMPCIKQLLEATATKGSRCIRLKAAPVMHPWVS